MTRSGETMSAMRFQISILQDFTIDFTKPQYTDKFQMNRLFVAHVQCTFVISGGRGTLKVCSSQVPSVLCTYLETGGVSLVSFQMSTDS